MLLLVKACILYIIDTINKEEVDDRFSILDCIKDKFIKNFQIIEKG